MQREKQIRTYFAVGDGYFKKNTEKYQSNWVLANEMVICDEVSAF